MSSAVPKVPSAPADCIAITLPLGSYRSGLRQPSSGSVSESCNQYAQCGPCGGASFVQASSSEVGGRPSSRVTLSTSLRIVLTTSCVTASDREAEYPG